MTIRKLLILSLWMGSFATSAQMPRLHIDSLVQTMQNDDIQMMQVYHEVYEEMHIFNTQERIDEAKALVRRLDATTYPEGSLFMARVLYVKALVQRNYLYLYTESLQNLLDAAEIVEKFENDFLMFGILHQLSSTNYLTGNDTEAVRIGKRASQMTKLLEQDKTLRDNYFYQMTAMSTYNTIGMSSSRLGDYDTAMLYFGKGVKIASAMKNEQWVAMMGSEQGLIYQKKRLYNNAIPLFVKSYRINQAVPDLKIVCIEALRIVHAYIEQRELSLAQTYLDSTEYFLNKAPDHEQELRIDYMQAKANLENARGHYEKAYFLQKQYTDSMIAFIRGQEAVRIGNMQGAYEFSRNEREIEALTYQTERQQQEIKFEHTMFLASILVLILVAALTINVVFNYRKQKKITSVIQLQNTEIQNQNRTLENQKEEIQRQNENLESTLKELEFTQDQLIHSEKMSSIGLLTAGLAHEINNPVNFIQSGTEALSDNINLLNEVLALYEQSTPANFAEQLNRIQQLKARINFDEVKTDIPVLLKTIGNGASRTATIVAGLQHFSRKGKEDIVEAPVADIIEDTLLLIHGELRDRIAIEKHFEAGLTIACRMGEMGQVFMNILMNAIQAIQGPGTIQITTERADSKAKITIRDSGPGIKPENMSKVFDPFFTTKDVGKGTGLGLSITHGIIETLGGKISVKSIPGQGATFTILMPMQKHS
jgi:signal transduction histidine kinase